MLDRLYKRWIVEEFTRVNRVINTRSVHSNHAAGADVQVADLTISHLSSSETDIVPGRFDQRVGIPRLPVVKVGCTGQGYRISLQLRRITESIQNNKHKRRVSRVAQTFGLLGEATDYRPDCAFDNRSPS
jgi:hypothetical protein